MSGAEEMVMASEAFDTNYLIIVGAFLACMLMAVIIAKMFKRRMGSGTLPGKQMVMKDHMMLGNHEKLCLVEVYGQSYLVGIVRQQPMTIAPVTTHHAASTPDAAGFADPSDAGDFSIYKKYGIPNNRAYPEHSQIEETRSGQSLRASRGSSDRVADESPLVLEEKDIASAPAGQARKPKEKDRSAILSAMREARRANPKLGF
tara:strand:+ start:236 stop:844 length:609 start_codon:yes stop_codon:yes gene_type:complete